MDLLTVIQTEPLAKIQEIVLQQQLLDSNWLDYHALNKALEECKRKDVAKWLLQLRCRVNKFGDGCTSVLGNIPLHNAVKLGDMEILELLLKNEAFIFAVDVNDNTALHISFLHRYDNVTDLLLGHMVEISKFPNIKNNQGFSHLHIACTRNNVKAVEGFLKAEVDINEFVKVDSPLAWAGYTALHFAVEFKSSEVVKILLASGGKMEVEKNNAVQSPLQLLHQYQVDYSIMSDQFDKTVFPYFHLACLEDGVDVVKKFIDKGADVNEAIVWRASLYDHYSPLHCAIESPYNRKEKVQLLLQHGARVEGKRYLSKHMTALHLAFYSEYHMSDLDGSVVDCLYKVVKDKEKNIVDKNGLSYFHVSVSRNDFGMVKMYLGKGADVNQVVQKNSRGFSGYAPLHFAAKYQLVVMAKFLIEHGADLDVDEDVFAAFETKNLNLIKLLMKSGDSDNFLLHQAVIAGNEEVVQYLINSGSDVNDRDDLGQTPLILSLKSDLPCKNIIDTLIEAGADMDITDYIGKSAVDILDSIVALRKDVKMFDIYKVFLEKTYKQEFLNFDGFELLVDGNGRDIEMLLQTGVGLSTRDSGGITLVHMLVRNLNPGVVEQLRGRNFDVNARDEVGWTPLIDAALYGNVNAVTFLLNEGAEIEAANVERRTALRTAAENSISENQKKCIQVLLEHGANAQTEIPDDPRPTIIDLVSNTTDFSLAEIIVAHLALQEANGTVITPLIRSKIDSHDHLKCHFDYCKQQLLVEMYQSVTLFDAMTVSEKNLERYARNEELASKLMDFQAVEYFSMMLRGRLSKAIALIELRKTAALIVAKLMKMNYIGFPLVIDEIVNYLKKRDLEYLVSIQRELQLDVREKY